jgi:CBS domain-containing protein
MVCVREVMTPKVQTVTADTTVSDAAKVMEKWKIGSLVVLKGNKPVGIITEGDVSKCVAKGLNPAKTTVTYRRKRLVTIAPEEQLEVAAKVMAAAGVKKLPVMDGNELVGMLTQTDIVNCSFALVTSLKEMVRTRYRPPGFEP